ncbi:MAG: type IV secretory system conjugative DNA transfer family protein [Eubacteriales bacterium]|nr:type IV secretory system conjugative DNA transfer family protein [Eubacteriales bacterium]
MNHKKWKLIFVLPLCLCTLYTGGYIAQFIRNYQTWTAAGNFAGNGSSPQIPSLHPSECFHALASYPYNLYGIFICLLLFGILVFLLMRMGFDRNGEVYDKERNLNYSEKGTYGTSGFMTREEMTQVLELTAHVKKNKGTILGTLDGKAVCLPYETRMNKNIAVYGASGSMKSRAFARNMILQCVARGKNGGCGESLIITDPKSELYESMSAYLENEGYTVKCFNLVSPENSDSWNCLMEIDGQETMAQVFSDVIIQNTGSGKGDHFWDNAELNLLKALVLYVEQGFPPESKNIGQVYRLLTMSSEKELNALFDLLPVSHPAKVPYCIYKQASDTVRSGVIIGLGARLQVFQNKLIRQITSFDEIDLTLPGTQKCAYFCITSDQDSTFDFLSSLFMTFVFIKLVRYADRYGADGKLPVPVHILADELANTGAILELNKKISVIRSRNISISCIFQNLPQMQNRYPLNQWQEIIGNCDTQLFLGCTDEVTASFISDRTGDITVGVSSEAKQLNSWRVSDYTPEYRHTRSIGKRKLLTPDEILRLPLDTALIILRGQKVLRVEKYDYTLHPDAKKLILRKACEHIPQWRENGICEEHDYTPKIPSSPRPRKKRTSTASMCTRKNSSPPATQPPVYHEPDYENPPSDRLQDDLSEYDPYTSDMIPLDKDSIMTKI